VDELVKVEQDMVSDPDGARLGQYLAAHLVLERAVRRRAFVAQVAAFLGVPLWFAIILSVPRPLFHLVLAGFALAAVGLLGAIASEIGCRQSIRQMARGVRVETIDAGDQRVAPRR
jgi:hypothetical protein